MRRLAALTVLSLLLVSAVGRATPTFGGFVGSAGSTVPVSIDALDQHVAVTVPDRGGEIEVLNNSSTAQTLAIKVLDPAGGTASAHFESSGGDHATIPAGAGDTVDLVDSSGNETAGKVELGVARPDGSLFPNGIYAVAAP